MVSEIRADPFCVCFRYRRFCRSLELFACERSYQTKLRESDFKKEQTLPRGREGEVSGEGGFELGCSCSPTRILLPPPSDSFFQRRLFFSREKKSAFSRSTVHTSRTSWWLMCFGRPARGNNCKQRITKKEACGHASLRSCDKDNAVYPYSTNRNSFPRWVNRHPLS